MFGTPLRSWLAECVIVSGYLVKRVHTVPLLDAQLWGSCHQLVRACTWRNSKHFRTFYKTSVLN